MAKTVQLHNDDDMIFIDVLPELRPDFIEKIRKQRQMFPHTKSKNEANINK